MTGPEDRSAIGTGLIEQDFQSMRQQRRRGRDQQCMVAGSPQGSPRPREASQPAIARNRRTFSSAPHVRARAISSGAGAVSRTIARAIATSAPVGRTVTGTGSWRRWRQMGSFRDLAAVCMT